ncbi:hypothetical protein OHC33_002815 [Knufia fluminis]|uniref:Uncharacterized protein n=1 Tax=Knufia fluminis TaxID=191047 RepID=A0AAN8IAZ7_9EURO|nr:hypothetical protein OHC33_002815 [Knufia fluminis]
MEGRHNSIAYPTNHIYGHPSHNPIGSAQLPTQYIPTYPNYHPPQPSPREIQLQQENAHLKAQLTILQAQRSTEQYAYNAFVDHVYTLDKTIPAAQRTPEYNAAHNALVTISQKYTKAQQKASKNPVPGLNQQTHTSAQSQPQQGLQTTNPLNTTISRELQSQRNRASKTLLKSDIRSEIHSITSLLRSINHRLSSTTTSSTAPAPTSLPPNTTLPPKPHLASTCRTLESRIQTHTDLLVSYMNGRYECISKDLRPKVKNLLEPFFAEPGDVRDLVRWIVSETRKMVSVDRAAMEPSTEDLVAPMRDVLGALVGVLEGVEGGLE